MMEAPGDVPETLFVFDCEWVGDLREPHKTHITEVAVYSVRTQATYHASCTALASTQAIQTAYAKMGATPSAGVMASCSDVLTGMIAFVEAETEGSSAVPVLIGHNAVRYDAPVLLHNMRRCNLHLPDNWLVMDSLHHARYHTRHRGPGSGFSLHQLCTSCNVTVDDTQLHGALYDTMLLHSLLESMSAQWQVPYISGYPQRMSVLSPMLIHGVGPSVGLALGTDSLHELCRSILLAYGNLGAEACEQYLADIEVRAALPKANMPMIATNIEPAAKRYLHYLA
jgi:DNA polymerase III epsilon subunit-like protein